MACEILDRHGTDRAADYLFSGGKEFVFGAQDQETLFEIGLFVSGLGLVSGLAALVLGHARERMRSGEHRAQNPPAKGSVPGERHCNIQTVAAR